MHHPHKQPRISAGTRGTFLAKTMACSLAIGALLSPVEVAHANDGTENILRAVRSWSSNGTALSDANLITHSAGAMAEDSGVTRLPSNGHDGVLSGEEAQVTWPFHLTAADLIAPVRLKVAFTNSATVLPEASRLNVLVNGVRVGSKALRHPDKMGHLELNISPSHLRAGRNELQLQAEQHHRVDCSLDGSYELWTAIDLQRTTLSLVDTPLRYRDLRDLAAFPRSHDQTVAFNMIMRAEHPATASKSNEALLLLTQQAVLAADVKSPNLTVLPAHSTDNGAGRKSDTIDLFVGSLAELVANDYVQRHYQIGNGVQLLSDQGDNIAMAVDKYGRRVLLARLDELAHRPDGFAFLAKRNEDQKTAQEESSISLKELGYQEREYRAQRFSETIELALPADFYPADYDSLDFHLFASYARSLQQGEIQLLINGKSKIAVPISRQSDGVIEDHLIKMPLSAFKPGVNDIEIIGLFDKGEEDGACATRLNRSREALFFLSGESYFDVPELAHLPILPNVRTTLRTGYPYRDDQGNGQIAIEIHDDYSRGLKVAGDFVAQMAINADEPFAVSLGGTLNGLSRQASNRVIIGSYATIPAQYAKFQEGVDLNALAQQSQYAVAPQAVDMMPTASIGSQTLPTPNWMKPSGVSGYQTGPAGLNSYQAMPPMPQRQPEKLAKDSLRDVFRRRAEKEREGFQFTNLTESLKSAFSPISGAVAKVSDASGDISPLVGNNKALISQKREHGAVTTLISYDMHATDYLGIDSLFASITDGSDPIHTVSISGFGDSLTQIKSRDPWIGDMSLSEARNLDLVFAGWLSNNPFFYAVLTFFSLLGFGLASSVLLARTKRSGGDKFDQAY